VTVRTLLVGRGLGGSVFHAPLIRAVPALELVGIVGAADAREAVTSGDCDLVVISTPNASHFPLAEAALEAGKHVVVDKPFTVTVEQADALIALAAERRRVLTVFHNRRWDGDFLTVKRLLGTGRLGEPILFQAHWDRFRPALRDGWKEDPGHGAGLLLDLGPHLVDQALQLFGPPRSLSADVAAQRPGGRVDDYFALTLDYGRLRVLLSAATLVAEPRPRFALHGTEGSYVKFGVDPQEAELKAGADPREISRDAASGILTQAGGTREEVPTERGRYLAFYEAVAAAVLDGTPAPVDAADAREGLRIIEAARASSAEGRVVSVSPAGRGLG
jgi:scyllo-inositol 2-dehydrogenase (NADP+)